MLPSIDVADLDGKQESPASEGKSPLEPPKLAVTVSTSFPASEIFGVKLVNGQQTEAVLSFANDEPNPIIVNFVGGSLWLDAAPGQPAQNVRNLTMARYNTEVAPSTEEKIPFTFMTDMHPQDLRLNLVAVVSDGKGQIFTMGAFNQTVSVVEPDTSIFDPQM